MTKLISSSYCLFLTSSPKKPTLWGLGEGKSISWSIQKNGMSFSGKVTHLQWQPHLHWYPFIPESIWGNDEQKKPFCESYFLFFWTTWTSQLLWDITILQLLWDFWIYNAKVTARIVIIYIFHFSLHFISAQMLVFA